MSAHDTWSVGSTYDQFMGRWSRQLAREMIPWLEVAPGATWLDVGCGAGALTATILALADPALVTGVDPSAGFLAFAAASITDARVTFVAGDAQALPFADGSFHAVASSLVLNFVPNPALAAAEMKRVAAVGGVVSAHVWDYAGTMEFLQIFWQVAGDLDARAATLREGRTFGALTNPDALETLWRGTGLADVESASIDLVLRFRDFDDYWSPFLGGQGPAPAYVASLESPQVETLRDTLRNALPIAADGSIALAARAWAVKGRVA